MLWRLGLLVGLLALAVACGSGSRSPSSPTPSSSGDDTFTGTLSSGATRFHTINVRKDGTMNVTLTWTGGGAQDMLLKLTDTSCDQAIPSGPNCTDSGAGGCYYLYGSLEQLVTKSVRAGEAYRAWVYNGTYPGATVAYNLTVSIDPDAPAAQNDAFTGTLSSGGSAFHTINVTLKGVMNLNLTRAGGTPYDKMDLQLTDGSCDQGWPLGQRCTSFPFVADTRGGAGWLVARGQTYRAWVRYRAFADGYPPINYTLTVSIGNCRP